MKDLEKLIHEIAEGMIFPILVVGVVAIIFLMADCSIKESKLKKEAEAIETKQLIDSGHVRKMVVGSSVSQWVKEESPVKDPSSK